MLKTFASFAFGCRVNQAEKEEIDRQLSAADYQYSETNPDFFIINSCAVTQKAEREVRQFIYQTRRKFPKTKIILTGCAATKWIKEKIKIPQVDLMIDNQDKEKQIIAKHGKIFADRILSERKRSFMERRTRRLERVAEQENFVCEQLTRKNSISEGVPKNKFTASGRLFVKIQDGCNRFCAYCIVPYLRGKPKSVRIKNLVRQLAERIKEINIKEVILTAINTECYGLDTGETLIELIENIIYKTNIPRISFGSIHPWSLTDEFLVYYRKILPFGRLVNFFHVPLQSGSNKILSLMKRDYTSEELMKKLKHLQKINPLAFIGTDVIVGFPGETEKDFSETYQFLKDSPISRFHIFRFSPREGTAAYFLRKKYQEPSPQVKSKRAKILAELSRQKYRKFLKKHLGQTFPALFLEKRTNGYQEALLPNQIPVLVKTKKDLKRSINKVKIVSLHASSLTGIVSD